MSAIAITMSIVAPLFLRGRAGRAGLLHSDFGAIMLHLKNQKKKSGPNPALAEGEAGLIFRIYVAHSVTVAQPDETPRKPIETPIVSPLYSISVARATAPGRVRQRPRHCAYNGQVGNLVSSQ